MRLSHHLSSFTFAAAITICVGAFGQNQSPEFIESSSPLPGGGRVISRSTSGSDDIQTVTSVPVTGQAKQSNRSSLGGSSNSALSGSVLENSNSQRRESVFRPATPTESNVGSQSAANVRYPYPTNNRPAVFNRPSAPNRVARAGLLHSPIRASATCTNCQTPFQVPTLGLNNTATSVARQSYGQAYGQGNCCGPNYNSNHALNVAGYQAPVLQIQPPANQVPSLAIQDPNPLQAPQFNTGAFQQAPFQQTPFQTVPQTPFGGNGQFGVQRNRWLDPLVTGSGVYQPIIRIANVKPGTYLGQGIIGQPTAYVDGQIVRNLLRYIFP